MGPLILKIMLVVVLILIPVMRADQIWANTLFKDKITAEDLTHDQAC
jgi:cytochrome bd-type quinol oxidase subunit 2